MKNIYLKDILGMNNATILYGDENLILDNFSKDTRTIKEGDIYLGIKGDTFDGNSFFEDALSKGAKACILDNINNIDINKYTDKTIIKVDNTIDFIGMLAKYKRELYDIPVIGVTGSVGKTSTKDMIASVLETKYKVLKTEGNNNNHIGLPLTILRLKDEDIMVIEMGMNNIGEISYLTNIAKPTIGVITNIGTAHIGNLGSRENIMKAKLEIIEGLSGPLIINNDNDIMHDNIDYIKSLNEVITIGINNNSDYMATDINNNLTNFKINGNNITCNIGSTAFIYNSLVSYAVGNLCDISVDKIKEGILNFKLSGNRLEYKKLNRGITLIDDTYNASLDSIKSSLEILSKEKGNRHIVVIGDILETGDYNREIHTKIGEELLKNNLDYIITIGNETKYTDDYLDNNNYHNKYHFSNENESYSWIDNLLKEGNVVLFKGSHGIHLNNIVNYLVNKER